MISQGGFYTRLASLANYFRQDNEKYNMVDMCGLHYGMKVYLVAHAVYFEQT